MAIGDTLTITSKSGYQYNITKKNELSKGYFKLSYWYFIFI